MEQRNEKVFDTFTMESCYWAGFIAADGCVFIDYKKSMYRISIHLHKKDIGHVRKFREFLNCKNKISTNKDSCYIQICSKHMTSSLERNFNIVPNKSLILEPPKKMPKKFISHYIRGYFDGDGHLGYKKGSTSCNFNIASGSEKMLEWTLLNLPHAKSKIYKKANCYSIDINNRNNLKILEWMYCNSYNNIRLDRKYDLYQSTLNSIDKLEKQYKKSGKRNPSGCKGFNLDYKAVSKEYLAGKQLKELAEKYQVSVWTLLDNFKKLSVSKKYKIKL